VGPRLPGIVELVGVLVDNMIMLVDGSVEGENAGESDGKVEGVPVGVGTRTVVGTVRQRGSA
jgi:hypothetical protein